MPTTDDRAAAKTMAALDQLLADAPGLAAVLPDGFEDVARRFVTLLLAANRQLNLTRVTNPDDIARLHLLDSLAALPILDAVTPSEVVDLGSGGGLPAIPLAIARPRIHWTLVDSVARKAAALQAIADALGLANVTVVAERAETMGRDPRHRERYAMATARACASLPVLAELALPLLKIGGSLLAWKGRLRAGDEEGRRGLAAIREVGGERLEIVGTGLTALGGHTFVTISKERPSPVRFPRRPGEPSRRPLG